MRLRPILKQTFACLLVMLLSVATFFAAPTMADTLSSVVSVVDIDARVNNQENPVVIPLAAGTYKVHVLTPSEGGKFAAWNTIDKSLKCDGDGNNCENGWETRYYFKSPYKKVVDGTCSKKKFDSCRYATAAQASADSSKDVTFTLAKDTKVKFYIYDTKLSNNQGGLSLQITKPSPVKPIPEDCRVSGKNCEVEIPSDPNKTVSVPVKIQVPEKAGTLPLDMMLVQDLTGSYKDDLPVLRSLVSSLVTELKTIQPDTAFGIASFRDKTNFGPPDYYVYKTELPLGTNNVDEFQARVNRFTTQDGDGKDFPESSLDALMQVALRAESELGFRKGTRRVAIVSTDESYHKAGDGARVGIKTPNNGDTILDKDEDYASIDQTREAINQANLLPIFLVPNKFRSTYDDLVRQLGVGAVITLNSDSSNLVESLKKGLEVVNQQLTIVVLDDKFNYVSSVDPNHFDNVAPGSEVTTNVNLKYSGVGTGETMLVRAIGIGDLVIDVVVSAPSK
jgi:Integrin beta chain VWA domain